ncbi:hypothetical protein, partial [Yersinia enterocolitica]|uniref:hypothetical protein n=1 Tax=Yersinia enterocolitica TaxID=630 RepID=UPI001E299542
EPHAAKPALADALRHSRAQPAAFNTHQKLRYKEFLDAVMHLALSVQITALPLIELRLRRPLLY